LVYGNGHRSRREKEKMEGGEQQHREGMDEKGRGKKMDRKGQGIGRKNVGNNGPSTTYTLHY